MLQTGADTHLEFSATVELILTTQFCLWVLSAETGKSRTLGELPGEKMDSLDSPQETLVESADMLVSYLNENDASLSLNITYYPILHLKFSIILFSRYIWQKTANSTDDKINYYQSSLNLKLKKSTI